MAVDCHTHGRLPGTPGGSQIELNTEARNQRHPHSPGAPRLGRPETTKQTVLPSWPSQLPSTELA